MVGPPTVRIVLSEQYCVLSLIFTCRLTIRTDPIIDLTAGVCPTAWWAWSPAPHTTCGFASFIAVGGATRATDGPRSHASVGD